MKQPAAVVDRGALHETIDDRSAGQRIDNFLRTRLKGVPKERIYRGLRRGEVRVNKGRIRASYKLCAGDVVRIPPWRRHCSELSRSTPPEPLRSLVSSSVLHEDDDLVVINKPAGLPVHGGSARPYGVIEVLRSARSGRQYLELVHRLDRDTSGCLLIAKHRASLTALHAMFREGKMHKTYLVLVRGKWTGGDRRICLALRKNRLRSGERVASAEVGGKPAVTHFKLLGRSATASLMEAIIDTGRTHQIRVHAQSINRPVGGDVKYGDKSFNRLCRERGLRRMFLHAASISFQSSGVTRTYAAPLGDELADALKAFGLGSQGRK